jgi:hypothetical protein
MKIIQNYKTKQLKQELKHLEKKYQTLIVDRDGLLKEIEEFNAEYTLRFEKLLNTILNLKENNVYKKIELRKLKKLKLLNNDELLKNLKSKKEHLQAQIDKVILELKLNGENEQLLNKKIELQIALDEVNSQITFIEEEKDKFYIELNAKKDEDLQIDYEEAKGEKKEFNEELKESQKINKLDSSQKIELKKLYRKLSKLIHPDVVDTQYKQQAQNLMAKLNELYRLNKLEEIENLYITIKNKTFIFVSDTLDNDEVIQQQIYEMKDKIVEVLKKYR